MFDGKRLLITGGTGSFGNAVIKRFLNLNLKEIRIFSRDEKKQDSMRKKYDNEKLSFYLGDIRDYEAIKNSLNNIDLVFHAAALKQVPSCEFFPLEAVKTNILGTANLIRGCFEENSVEKVITLSTDKAVYPVNAMGISKAMMEKVMIAESTKNQNSKLILCGTRYGNVMGSRGSVIPLFIKQIRDSKPLTITNPNMTRFMMTLDDSIELVIHAFEHGNSGDIFVHKAPSVTIEILAKSILEILGKDNHPIEYIGNRHGEKLYESLMTREELLKSIDMGNFFRIVPDTRDLNYKKYFDGQVTESFSHSIEEDYNSNNVEKLTLNQMKEILIKSNLIS